jgi:hypothetical protein
MKDTEELEKECREDLREIAHFFGGWDELRKVIDELEQADFEAAWERHVTDY